MKQDFSEADWEQAKSLLGVTADADEARLRTAYLDKVRQHPPDREPEMFEQIRDAYERLRDPRLRARRVLGGPNADEPLTTLLDGASVSRRFVGVDPWLNVLKEKRS